ncbi:unnamed protein product [Lymnaea stagnalis]|uniref:F-box domain-containing protein n=1 Tax=Lymnaea stagnalis TaxID=6523 RepID=A0AAV2HZ73_LYMST
MSKMSSYMSSRRRFSEPEKPQPRFEWRLRVHSLMMDDSEKENCDAERRVDGKDRSRAAHDASAAHVEHFRSHRSGVDPPESHRERRERYSRTKSEGHLQLRLRLSKYSDYSRSQEEEAPMVEAYHDVTRSETKEAPGVAQENIIPDNGHDNGAKGGCDPPQSKDQHAYSKYAQSCYEGAIPKRRSSTAESAPDELVGYYEEEQGQGQKLFREHNVNGFNVERSNYRPVETQNTPTDTNATIQNELCGPEISDRTLPADDECRERSESVSDNSGLEDGASGVSEPSGEDKGEIEDIETIIERLIAEEEAMADGQPASLELVKVSLKHLSDGDVSELRRQVDELREKVDDCNKEAEYGISRDSKRSSSLPSQDRNDFSLVRTVVPYSSSCPFTKDAERDVKDEDDEKEEGELDSWAYLPVILIEDIFTLLTPKERHQASQVCRQWYDLFYSPRVWETFILLERTLTKKRFNLYKGYQRELCPGKTQLCFRRVGSFFKRIVVTPITDYFNLYEFLRILAAFLQFQEDHGQIAMPLLHTFDFTFACASRSEGVEMVHGTGGQILEMIKQLLVRMSNLKHLKLNQLLIDVMDVPSLFDAITNCFGESLSSLEMLNVSKVPLALPELARFRNLIKLSISPQHLSEEVLLMLAGLNIMQLFLVQDPYTCECEPVSSEAWKLMREMAPWLHVYLEVSGRAKSKVLIQPRAPVHGIFLRTPYTRLTSDLVMSLVEHYSKTLRYFVQERLPRVHGPRGFNFRCDSSLLFLVRRCRSLHTLIIRERISTATLILVANEGKRLSTLLARKYGLIKRCDWLRCGEMSKDFYAHLKRASLNYDECTDEVCRLLQRRWRPLTDRQFMRLKIVPRLQVF